MANTATAQASFSLGSIFPFPHEITPTVVSIDTLNSDLTVVAAATGKQIAVVSFSYVGSSAANVTLKSGSTTRKVLELAANSGVWKGISPEILFITAPGEALVMRSSAAITNAEFFTIKIPF